MNRDEILTKSRAENVMEDERGRLTKLESARFSHCVFLILYCLLKLFVPLDDIGDYALSLLFFGSVFSQFVYYAVKQKSISFGIFSAICAFFTLTALFSLLSALGLPTASPCTAEDFAAAVGLDKKGAGEDISVILLERMGRAVPHRMPKAKLLEELR